MREDSHRPSYHVENGAPAWPLPARTERFVARAARSSAPVLLEGETGTGKSTLARLIHAASPRAVQPFVRVDCAALPEGILERELFGHVRGAFTGASDSRQGFVEAAHGGTLFLDEIGELPLPLQSKLLSLIEDRVIRRLGAVREIHVDLRIIAATNRDLAAAVEQGTFRTDLYYRCRVLSHRVPPLRERPWDLPKLIPRLLERIVADGTVPGSMRGITVSAEAYQVLSAYDWPGNIRELKSVLTEAALTAEGCVIKPVHLPQQVWRRALSENGTAHGAARGNGGRKTRYVAPDDPDQERRMVVDALRAAGGNRSKAAKRLGMSRQTLWIRLKLYGLDGPNQA